MRLMINKYESWMKTATYCIMHFIVAMIVAYALSGDIRIALSIGIIEPLVQTVFFNMHERAWKKIARKAATG